MNIGTLRVSRWVLIFEMIMCFWWLTWMFGALASRGVYGFVPDLPLDQEWTDAKLYKRYGLTTEEIVFIESQVADHDGELFGDAVSDNGDDE